MAVKYGSNADDSLTGIDNNDSLFGFDGDDTLTGKEGDDTLLGGPGTDVAVFSGPQINYTITETADGILVTDVVGDDGADLLVSIETASFSDGDVDISGIGAGISVADLDGSNGFRLDGVALGDTLRYVSGIGDFNGDGIDDLIAGAPEADPNGDGSGAAYVFFGTDQGFAPATSLASLNGSNGFRIDGLAADDHLGRAVSGAGDINNDGFDDLIVGVPEADFGALDAGSAYVVFGTDAAFGASFDLTTLDGSNGFRIDGVTGSDNVGESVSAAGDFNDDDFGDILIGAPSANYNGSGSGSGYLLFGMAGGFDAVIDLGAIDGSDGVRLDGEDSSDTGVSVSNAGDVNNDGNDDFLIGANQADNGVENGDNSGAAWVVFGNFDAQPATKMLDDLDGTKGFRLSGVTSEDFTGRGVGYAGDVNGDGFDDLIVGAPNAGNNGAASGSAYVVFGMAGGFAADIDLGSLDGDTGFRLDGEMAGDNAGHSVSGAGDINGDGFDDVIVGAWGSDGEGPVTGTSYVVYGRADGFDATMQLASISRSEGFRLEGEELGFNSGFDVNRAGDVNGDGFDDLILAAYGADYNGAFSGSAYVLLGSAGGPFNYEPTGSLTITGDATQGSILTAVDSIFDADGKGDVSYEWFADGALIVGATGDTLTLTICEVGKPITVVASYTDDNGTHESVISDPTDPVSHINSIFDITTLDGSYGFRLDGVSVVDRSGWSVSSAGDFNDDGFDDLIIGAFRAAPNGAVSGAAYVVFSPGAGFPAAWDLATLDGTDGFRLEGAAPGDTAGYSVSSAGDVNGDGFADVIVGANGASLNGGSSGSSYVVFGDDGVFAPSINLATLDGANGFRLDGEAAGDGSGFYVSGGGDVNGDGFDDVIVGSQAAPGGTFAGATYVVFGMEDGFAASMNLADLDGGNGFRLDGSAGQRAGISVSHAGDINDDGFDDVIVGASAAHRSYVVYGKEDGFAASMDLADLDGTDGFEIVPQALGFAFGISVSDAGDVNGDGIDDIIIGADMANYGSFWSGASYIVFGNSGGFGAQLELDELDGSNGFRLLGRTTEDRLGISVSGAGDFNGDGFADLIVGAEEADVNGVKTGSSYLVFGKEEGFDASMSLADLDGRNGFRMDGGANGDEFGKSVSAAGDVNNDGYDDLIVGANLAEPHGVANSGSSYVIFGRPDNGVPSGGVAISGAPTAGTTLTVNLTVDDPEGMTSPDWQWFGDGVKIEGATSAAYEVTDFDVGKTLTLTASYFDGASWFEHVTSAPTAQISGGIVSFGLGDLDGDNGFRIDGDAETGDQFGQSISNAGDINGDGFDDVIVGDWFDDPNGGNSGSAAVLFGAAGGFAAMIASDDLDGNNGFRLEGVGADDHFGISVSGAGDINGDGFDDIIVGAENANPNGFDSGSSYVMFGKAGGFDAVFDPAGLDGTNGFRLDGNAVGDSSGMSVSDAGDINGDGFDDLIIGAQKADPGGNASGASYVLFGKAAGFDATMDLNSLGLASGFRIFGESDGDELGVSVSGAGDVNGDGFDDFLLGAFGTEVNGDESGTAYLIFGKSTSFGSTFELGDLDGSNGIRLDGMDGDRAGWSVSGAGDINGDGFDDVIVGAPYGSPNGNRSGTSYVMFGKEDGFAASMDLADLDGSNGFRLQGDSLVDYAGHSVSGAGDVNGDGYDDLIVGAYMDDNAGSASGSSYLIFGRAEGFTSMFDLANLGRSFGLRLDGAGVGDESGWSVGGGGDVNGDGFDDVLIGAPRANPDGNDSGAGYVVFGADFAIEPADGLLVEGDEFNNALEGSPGNDTLIGNGGRDILQGFAGDDLIDGGEDIDTAVFEDTYRGEGELLNYDILNVEGELTITGPASDGTDILTNVERLLFDETRLAFDLDGAAGNTAKLLSILLGPDPDVWYDPALVGIGIDILDAGFTYDQLMDVAIDVVLGENRSDGAVVDLLVFNLFAIQTPQDLKDDLVALLVNGTFTQTSLAITAADTELHLDNIGFDDLVLVGVEYELPA